MMPKINLISYILQQLEVFLSKRRINFVCLTFLFVFSSCSKQIYSVDKIKKLEPTHSINSNLVIDILDDFEKKKIFDKEADTYVIYIDEEKSLNYKIDVTKTEFYFFRTEKSDYYFKRLKGYFLYQNSIVLLYGDIDNNLFNRSHTKKENIMFFNSSVKNEPIIYEPTFVEYRIKI